MTRFADEAVRWLAAAKAGSQEALGELLQACRHYLLRIASRHIEPVLRAKGGASDVVQQTFLEAQRDFPGFRGESAAELLAWLRQLLLYNLANFRRRYRSADKRQVEREVALAGDRPSAESGLAADMPSPSKEAMALEEAEALERALARLPEDYRQAIRLRYHEKRSFREIGRLLGRSTSGARVLWLRALERLQHEVENAHERGRADARG